MNAQFPTTMHAPLLITGIAATLFSTAAMTVVTIAGWLPGSIESFDENFIHLQPPESSAALLSDFEPGVGQSRVKARCEECGEIESMRKVAAVGNSPTTYEITVRMRDGSTRVNSDASPANWRPGDRMLLIGGAAPSGR